MAKLSSRGRYELFRMSREQSTPADEHGIVWRKHTVTLMSDGNFLERTGFKASDRYAPKGIRHESGTWKVRGKIKGDLSVEKAAEIYAKKGYVIDEAMSLSPENRAYIMQVSAAVISKQPLPPAKDFGAAKVLRTEKQVVAQKASKEKAAVKREVERKTKHGEGYYVRNISMAGMKSWATNFGPTQDLEKAVDYADKSYENYLHMKFNYLLPVQIVKASSRSDAEWGEGGIIGGKDKVEVVWQNGKMKPTPVDPNQLGLRF